MRARLLASSMICGAALVAGSQAFAQQAASGSSTAVGEIVVTGSRIPQPNLTSASPITVVGSQEAKLEGTANVETLLNQLPQVFAGFGEGITNSTGGIGIATVDLRGLGPARTLVLINGHRLMPGDPEVPYADLNFVPAALVDHVEVLTGGASATYGSDAVSGVVNFIMDKNFEGVRLDAQASTYEHDNSDSSVEALATNHGFPTPKGSIWDGRQVEASVLLGVNSPDGKGNATLYATYLNIQPILESHRDYSACTLGETATYFACAGSGTTSPADIISNDLANAGASPYRFIVDKGGPGNSVRQYNSTTDAFNYGPFNYYQRPDERYSAGAFAHYDVNDHLQAYTELMFMDDHTVAQVAPSGVFGQTFNISCSNPLLSFQEVTALCTNAGLGPTDSASLAILRRNVEGGPRIDDNRHTDYRILIGAKGDIAADWNYDVSAQLGRDVYQEEFLNDISLRNVTSALGDCADGAAGCVPYNIFQLGQVTPAALNYIESPGFKDGSTTEMIVSANLTGKVAGLKSPYASDPLGVAFGSEYRREALDFRVDSAFESGDLTGQGGPLEPVAGAYQVYELYGEGRLPLAQDMPFAKSLNLDVGYRFSDYSTAGVTSTYKVAGDWRPVDDLLLRATYERAVRAPNINELFTPQSVGLALDNDPCAGTHPTYTQAQCANTGVTAGQYGHIALNTADQYNGLLGGNPSLKPEKADTFTVGGVLTPHVVPGLSVSVDYYNIKVNNYIQALDPQLVLNACGASGDPTLCALVKRDPNTGSLWLGTKGYVVATDVNVGYLKTSGLDFELNYRTPFSRFGWENGGSLAVSFNGTYLMDLSTNPGIPPSSGTATDYNCAGFYGLSTCATPNPKWRHRLRVTWTTPWSGFELSGAWRYYGAVEAQGLSSNPYLAGSTPTTTADARIAAQNYFDLSAQWKVQDHVTFRLGVNNVFDKDPPLVGSSVGGTDTRFNGNTYPTVYDSLGRYAFLGMTADF
jgi:outer membrane receptor protein involved in Fe transport